MFYWYSYDGRDMNKKRPDPKVQPYKLKHKEKYIDNTLRFSIWITKSLILHVLGAYSSELIITCGISNSGLN